MSVLLCLPASLDSAVLARLSETGHEHLVARRCADLPEVMAGARARIATLAIISEDTEFLDVTVVTQLQQFLAVAIIPSGQTSPNGSGQTSPNGSGQTSPTGSVHSWSGVEIIAPRASEIVKRIRDAQTLGAVSLSPDVDAASTPRPAGAMVAVWGPPGSHGRSSLVRDCSVVLGRQHSVLAVDGDTFSPSLAQFFDVPENSGLIGLARMIDQGRSGGIDAMCTEAPAGLGAVQLLAGMNIGQRWREVSRPVADRMWPALHASFDRVVVDVSGGLDERVEREDRWAVTRSVIEHATVIVHVATANPIGLRRLIEHWDARGQCDDVPQAIVLTQVRTSALGPRPLFQAQDVLRTVGMADIPLFGICDEGARLDKALLAGTSMPMAYPKSGYSRSVQQVCAWIEDTIGACESISP